MKNKEKDVERSIVFLTGSSQFFDRKTSERFPGKIEGSSLWRTKKGTWILQYIKSDDSPFSHISAMTRAAHGMVPKKREVRYEKMGEDQAIRWLLKNDHVAYVPADFLKENEL